jgi:hypothetical protein
MRICVFVCKLTKSQPKKNQKISKSQGRVGVYLAVTLAKKKHKSKIPNSHCAASALAAIVLRRRYLIAHCNLSAVPPSIALPSLPIAAAAAHCNHAATIHHDCHCYPSCVCVASNCAASALAAIVRRPLCRPSCHCCPITQRNWFAVLPPIAPPALPIATQAALRVSYSQQAALRVSYSWRAALRVSYSQRRPLRVCICVLLVSS